MKHMSLIVVAALVLVANASAQSGGTTQSHLSVVSEHQQTPTRGVTHLDLAVPIQERIVRGAPYSAETVSESVQALTDGNRIVRRNATRVYRDSEGRTRVERLNPAGAVSSVSISDPVSGETLMLNPETRTAMRSTVIVISHGGGATLGATTAGEVTSVQLKTVGESAEMRQKTQHLKQAELTARAEAESVVVYGGVISHVSEGKTTREELGQQTIEGVLANGTRTTTVIEAGAMGNEQPIQIVSEQWYSPDLKTLVLTRHSDPRSGENTFRLTNIVRSEPDRSLFTLPPDYTIKESPIRRESR